MIALTGPHGRLTRLLVIAAMLVCAAPAAAAPRRVLVLPFSGSLPDAPTAPARLTEVVARAAGLTGSEVILGKATFADTAALSGCVEETVACMTTIATSLQVDQVVIGAVEATAAGEISVSLKVFAGGELSEKTLSFPASDLDTLVDRLAREVPAVFATAGIETQPREPEPAPEPRQPPPRLPPPAPVEHSGGDTDDGFRLGRVGLLPWVVAGTGVAAAGTGAVLYVMGRDRQDQVDSAPVGSVEDLDALVELEDEGDRYLKLGSGMMIGGGAVIAAGVVLIVLDGRRGDQDRASMAIAPMVLGDGLGLCVEITR